MIKKIGLIISCEHGVNTIPPAYESLFQPFEHLLNSHQGIDFGALETALHFKEIFSCDLIQAQTSRLLIDCNRSLNNRSCLSEITKTLNAQQQAEIIAQYYLPYRQSVQQYIERFLDQGLRVLHCSIHSFTPILNEKIRHAEIGFLYDPQRPLEKKLARNWQLELQKHTAKYRIRMNYPYQGVNDGLTTSMRKLFASEDYQGIELELNQSLTQNPADFTHLKNSLTLSLNPLINNF